MSMIENIWPGVIEKFTKKKSLFHKEINI